MLLFYLLYSRREQCIRRVIIIAFLFTHCLMRPLRAEKQL